VSQIGNEIAVSTEEELNLKVFCARGGDLKEIIIVDAV
jgi:hypothetical protein